MKYFVYLSSAMVALKVTMAYQDDASFASTSNKNTFDQDIALYETDTMMLASAVSPSNVELYAAGYKHNCVVFQTDKRMKCWGSNTSGQLGYGDTNNRGDQSYQMGENLTLVDLGKGVFPKILKLGGFHTCIVAQNNTPKCFGDNRYGQLALGDSKNRGDDANEMGDKLPFINLGNVKKVQAIAVGFMHTCFYLTNKKVACFGNNEHGQLGYGDTQNRGSSLNHVGKYTAYVDIKVTDPHNFVSGPSSNHSCIFDRESGAKCWGSNALGQLGYGDTNNRGDQPNEMGEKLPSITMPEWAEIYYVVVGGANTCFQFNSGDQLLCVGSNEYGQLGLHSFTHNVNGKDVLFWGIWFGHLFKMKIASVGANHICAVTKSNEMKCVGKNTYGQLGQGDNIDRGFNETNTGNNLPYINLSYPGVITDVGAGNDFTCVNIRVGVRANTIKCFGIGSDGVLGYGDTKNRGDEPNEMGNDLPVVFLRYSPPSQAPSSAPTFKPTAQPTRKPTKKSKSPTKYPIKYPTSVPTTKYPTASPSKTPSRKPTHK